LISESLRGLRNPFFSKKHTKLNKELISKKKSKGLVYIYDDMLNFLVIFTSLTNLKKTIKANMSILKKSLESNRLFRGS
jgi:hypothetical protein